MVFNCELVYYEPNNTVDENFYIIYNINFYWYVTCDGEICLRPTLNESSMIRPIREWTVSVLLQEHKPDWPNQETPLIEASWNCHIQ